MASKLVPLAFRSASRALRVQRPQFRAFSVTRPARSDSLMVVRLPSPCSQPSNASIAPLIQAAAPRLARQQPLAAVQVQLAE